MPEFVQKKEIFTNGFHSGDQPVVRDWVTCLWSLVGRSTNGSWSVTYSCLWKRNFYKWSLFGWPTRGSRLSNLPIVSVRVTSPGSWSGNLLMFMNFFFTNGLYLNYQPVVQDWVTCINWHVANVEVVASHIMVV